MQSTTCRRRRPSPAFVVSIVSLFLALSGVGIAANGQSLILGTSNSATSKTSLTTSLNGRAFEISNPNTGSGATAFGLNVASGKAPFSVNSSGLVAHLNADQIDGYDATSFLPLGSLASMNGRPCAIVGGPNHTGGLQLFFTNYALDGAAQLNAYCLTRDGFEPNETKAAATHGPVHEAATIYPAQEDDWYTATCATGGSGTCDVIASVFPPAVQSDIACDGTIGGTAFTGCQHHASDGQSIILHVRGVRPTEILRYDVLFG